MRCHESWGSCEVGGHVVFPLLVMRMVQGSMFRVPLCQLSL